MNHRPSGYEPDELPTAPPRDESWWMGLDSNQRSETRQIYSLLPLTTREPIRLRQKNYTGFRPVCQQLFINLFALFLKTDVSRIAKLFFDTRKLIQAIFSGPDNASVFCRRCITFGRNTQHNRAFIKLQKRVGLCVTTAQQGKTKACCAAFTRNNSSIAT